MSNYTSIFKKLFKKREANVGKLSSELGHYR